MRRKKVVYVQQQPGQNNGGCGLSILALLVLGGIASAFGGGDNNTDEERNTTTTEITTTEYVEELSNEEQFIRDFGEYQSDDVAKNIYDLYTNDIGFKEIEFEEQLDNSLNYKIYADGYTTVITIINDGDYRIFAPNSSFVFYENMQVVTTAEDLENQTIDSIDMTSYYVIAKTEIESCLKNPKSADFPSQSEISYQRNKDLVALQGYVYAENSFGATVKSNWTIQFYVHDLDQYSYTVTYINIDGNSSGEWIEFE